MRNPEAMQSDPQTGTLARMAQTSKVPVGAAAAALAENDQASATRITSPE